VSALTATIGPTDEPVGETAVALRIVNESDAPVTVLNPDLGRPAEGVDWPFSVEAYRAALLMSFGFLTVAVHDESGDEVEREPVSTWSTPLVRPPVALAPGGSLEVVIPVGPFFPLAPATVYRVTAEYGDAARVRAEGTVQT
jgi:hypothetical protein